MMKRIIIFSSALLITSCTVTHKSFKPIANPNPIDPTLLQSILDNAKIVKEKKLNDRAFGTRYGITKKEILNSGVLFANRDDVDNIYFSNKAPLTNRNFNLYGYSFDKNDRLCKIVGIREVNTLKINEIKNDINSIKNLLTDIYGEPKHVNRIDNYKNWLNDNNGGKRYSYIWMNEKTVENEIAAIFLFPGTASKDSINVYLYYIFLFDCDKTDTEGL